MYDPAPMYPVPFHPTKRSRRRDWKGKVSPYTRTQRPPTYYLIDLGLSRRYDPAKGPALDFPIPGGDKSAPEFRELTKRCDSFATDIYYLGNLIREEFWQKYKGFEFIEGLMLDMVQDDPSKRPKIDEVVKRFKEIEGTLGTWKLRSRLPRRHEFTVVTVWKGFGHWYRTAGYLLTRKSPLPVP